MAVEKSPSTGKTVAISSALGLSVLDLLYTTGHDIYKLDWMTMQYCTDLMVVSSAIAGGIMHLLQRNKEKKDEPLVGVNSIIQPDLAAATAAQPLKE